jgi:hypothetical protein
VTELADDPARELAPAREPCHRSGRTPSGSPRDALSWQRPSASSQLLASAAPAGGASWPIWRCADERAGTDAERPAGSSGGCGRLDRSSRRSAKHGIALEFAPEARERIIVLAGAGAAAVEALCTKLFANYPLGLNLLRERTGRDTFAISAAAIADPEGYLNGLIRENYAR